MTGKNPYILNLTSAKTDVKINRNLTSHPQHLYLLASC